MTGFRVHSGDAHGNGDAESEHGAAYLYLKKEVYFVITVVLLFLTCSYIQKPRTPSLQATSCLRQVLLEQFCV